MVWIRVSKLWGEQILSLRRKWASLEVADTQIFEQVGREEFWFEQKPRSELSCRSSGTDAHGGYEGGRLTQAMANKRGQWELLERERERKRETHIHKHTHTHTHPDPHPQGRSHTDTQTHMHTHTHTRAHIHKKKDRHQALVQSSSKIACKMRAMKIMDPLASVLQPLTHGRHPLNHKYYMPCLQDVQPMEHPETSHRPSSGTEQSVPEDAQNISRHNFWRMGPRRNSRNGILLEAVRGKGPLRDPWESHLLF